MKKILTFFTAAVLIIPLFTGCLSDDEGDTTPAVTTQTWQGAIVDTQMQAALAAMGYTATKYTYELKSDNTFSLKMFLIALFGTAEIETGTYTISGGDVSFTPLKNYASNTTTHVMEEVTPVRTAYTGLQSATSITIDNFLNIPDMRDLGTLTLTKQ